MKALGLIALCWSACGPLGGNAWPALGAAAMARSVEAPLPAPSWRADLGASFGTALCAGEISAVPLASWAAQVYDAQIDGHLVAARHGLPLSPTLLAGRGKSLATLKGLGGYGYGSCADGRRAWIAAVPAPKPLVVEAGRLRLPVAELKARCSSYRADFAARRPSAGVRSVSVAGPVALAPLGDGVLSITCQPRAPRWQGPVLWYLYPVGQGPEASPPAAELLTADPQTLLPWLTRVRTQLGLPPLATHEQLQEVAANLAADGSLTHNRLLLQNAARSSAERQVQLLGEDRVRGRSAQAMAWLLWNSPRHRELLLNREANAVGLGLRAVDDDQLAVLSFGKAQLLNTARGPAKAGTPSAK